MYSNQVHITSHFDLQLYDPTVNYDSDSDSELNNARDKTHLSSSSPPTSSCFKDAFIHNHLERKGGPQSDRGGAAAGATGGGKKKKCTGCRKETEERWDGNRYNCSTNKKPNAKEWLKKHKFDWSCANRDKCPVDSSAALPPNYPGHTQPNKVD